MSKQPIAVQLVTFRLPLGTTGKLDEPQKRYRVETVQQYRAVVRKECQFSVVENSIRSGEKVMVRENGTWCTLTDDSVVVEEETVYIER